MAMIVECSPSNSPTIEPGTRNLLSRKTTCSTFASGEPGKLRKANGDCNSVNGSRAKLHTYLHSVVFTSSITDTLMIFKLRPSIVNAVRFCLCLHNGCAEIVLAVDARALSAFSHS
eukprot:m.443543 g.443543  ORF g.443543 m.443543 type:complete len:116 (+) comp18978_c0_seq1:2277-2624(+)